MPKEKGEQLQETENEEELEDEEDEFEAHDNESPSSGSRFNWLYESRVYYYYSCSEI